MAGINFDRQVFVPPTEPPRRFALQALGPALFVLAIGAVSLIGYKVYNENFRVAVAGPPTPEVDSLRQQLADMQKRLDQLEKHRRPIQDDARSASKVKPLAEPMNAPPARIVYQVTSASKLPAVSKPASPATLPSSANANTSTVQNELAANHEAWQATTDRLADVVGVVGAQQGEISQTREALNQLLAQSKRRALSFELQRGNSRMPVGPLTLQLKSVDTKTQHYSVCVYFEERCIELKDRALNEVVVFMVTKDSAPLELVVTKIMRDQILGYLEISLEARPSPNEGR
jgi:uncharacterized membrane protein YdfJ with MMPL/SSD domain